MMKRGVNQKFDFMPDIEKIKKALEKEIVENNNK